MNQNSDINEEENEDEEEEEEGEGAEAETANENSTDKAKRKKRKKRRRKLENSKLQVANSKEEDVDEIERTVKEVNKLLGEPLPGCSFQNTENSQVEQKSKEDILLVQHKHLNPYNELKRIFGSKTVKAEQKYVFLTNVT